MSKKVYILNDKNQYIGEGIEAFGISYVNKTEVAPDSKFLNGDYDVVWNGKEWEYIKVKGLENPQTLDTLEPTPEELKKMEEEREKQREEHLRKRAKEIYPYLKELFYADKSI